MTYQMNQNKYITDILVRFEDYDYSDIMHIITTLDIDECQNQIAALRQRILPNRTPGAWKALSLVEMRLRHLKQDLNEVLDDMVAL